MNGREIRVNACVDTGFTGSSEVRIPSVWLRLAEGKIFNFPTEDSNGERGWALGTLEGKLIAINGVEVSEEIVTVFGDGDPLLGLAFLQRCILHIDGPMSRATLSMSTSVRN
jgi:hypothetical protein